MELKIVFSKTATRDLNLIFEYIKKDSVKYAHREIQLVRAVIKKLKVNSYLGRKFEKENDDLTREMIFKNYRIIYDIVPKIQITILSIHHHSRLISNNSAFQSEE